MTGVPAAAIEASRVLLGSLPIGIAIYDRDAALVLANPAYADTLGVAAPLALDGHVPGTCAVRRQASPTGTTIEVRTLPLAHGGYVSVLNDVTPLAVAQAQFVQRAATLDTMLAHIKHGIVLWDREGRVIACNAMVVDVLGVPEGFLVPGRTLEETIQSALDRGNLGHGQTGILRADALRQKDRRASSVDQRLTRHGRVLEVRSDPTPDGGFVTTYTDVTPIREAEEALKQAKAAAEAANTAKSRAMAAMGQELQRPLRSILGQADALARAAADAGGRHAGPLDPAEVLDSARAMLAAGQRLLGTIDAILDVARLEAGRFDLSADIVDVPSLVQTCLRHMDAPAAAADLLLSVDLPPGLPAVHGDARRLGQVLNHLVANAIRFTGQHGAVTIAAEHHRESGGVRLQVGDTGIGIPEAELDRVFEPFTQLCAGLDRLDHPTGLGLYVSRAVMRAHGGELTLHSRPGHGTMAVMHVPALRVLDRRGTDPT